jgi:carboxyl-terminal processing protease
MVKVVSNVYFKGRTVFVLLLMTMVASVLVTLTIGDQIFWPANGKQASVSAAASSDRNGLNAKEESKINAVLGLIETKYFKDIDRDELVDGAVRGMMESLDDPYSVYMEKDVAKQFSESIEGSFSGIGAEVTLEKGKVVVVAPIKGSPAEKAGLLAKDIVLSVNGEKLDGLTLNDAVGKIRGPKGTKAKLQIERTGNTQPIDLILVRDDIDVETVYANLRNDGTGVIEIRQFSLNTADRFKEELARLEKQGMKGLVIDVRNDPGGILPVVVEIAQQFIKKGETIVQVEDREGDRDKTASLGGGKDYPIAVLMNKGSASASEILAGALQERAGAILVGETSYGKGTVQVSYNKTLGDGSLVKMTIAKWLTPDGNWIHQKGIKPTIEVLPPKLYTVARLTLTETLKKDMIGEQIRNAQVMLSGLGYSTQREDGYFSASTELAVKNFQQSAGLPTTGQLDTKTASSLEQAVVKWIKDENNDKQLLEAIQAVSRK